MALMTISRHRPLMAMGLLPQVLVLVQVQVLPQQAHQLKASGRDPRLAPGAAHQQRGRIRKHMRPLERDSRRGNEA